MTILKASFQAGVDLLTVFFIERASDVPIINMNQGNTKSATVNPFHAECWKNEKKKMF